MPERSPKRNTKPATIADVAKLAKTSIATVSYVLNDDKERYIRDELREKVISAAAELNYVKSSIASSLKGKSRGIIAVLTPQFENHFFMSVFIAVEKIANKYGYVLSTCNTFDDPTHEGEVLERMFRLRADGYIIIPTVSGTENTRYIRELGIPFVSVERPLDGISEYDFISSDNFDAGYSITKHMVDMGHRNIAFIGWDTEVTNLHEREQGYRKALSDSGIEVNPGYILAGDIIHEDGARLTAQVIEKHKVTAIVYGQYMIAEGGIKETRRMGLKIPNDISVALIGCPAWTHMSELKYTSAVQPAAQMGEEAARILMSRISGENKSHKPVQIKLPCSIIYGESVKDLR